MARKFMVFILLLLLVPYIYGCVAILAGAAAGAGTSVWLSDKLTQEVNASYDKTINAAKSALRSLKLSVEKETKKDEIAQIISKYSDGKTVWIDIRKVTEKISKIDVRVGMMGDEEATRKIMDKILRYL